ncbi:MAG: hypothetical protein ACYTEZ_01495 [Planctomycetota bacterium]|jgi:hypothetical protein
MRILTLLAGEEALPDVLGLTREIRSFNAEIDFRLRFLHIEIEEVYGVAPGVSAELRRQVERADVREIHTAGPLEAAAHLALLLNRERPDLVVIAGSGGLLEPGIAAARACRAKLAFYGAARGSAMDGRDLGEDPRAAVERLTGVAREIQ